MTSSREEDERVMEILAAARRRPAGEREAYLRTACAGDEDLRREVADALSWEERMGGFLQQPVAVIADGNPDSAVTGAVQFAAGQEIGQYRLESKLGEGGMSTVWLALDTRLGRRVAIKFLSDDLADAEARRRFQREAQMASSLNHPHIVTVYDTGEFEGRQYLVTEYVDGGTLKDWVKEKRRTAKEVAELLTPVADGLAAAHQAGILHRDIKPMNILVARNGYAKLADFGLAKLAEDSRIDLAARSPEGSTRPGLILGTIAYMSPEQASGQPLDSRSDIFSFGVVLYEMLSGKRPFGGRTDLEVLKTIIHGELPPLSEEVPEAHRNVVEKALEKSPAERYQSMREMVVDLRRGHRSQRLPAPGVEGAIARVEGGVASPGQLAEELSPESEPPLSSKSVPPAEKSGPRPKRTLTILAACCAVVLLGAAAWFVYTKWRANLPSTPVQRALTRLTSDDGLQTGAAWSPDGRLIAYASDRGGKFDIWVQQVSGGDPIQITKGAAQNWQPDWSPDGKYIAYRSEEGDGGIYITPALGGAGQQRKIAPFGYSPLWSPDSSRILLQQTGFLGKKIYVVDLDGSPPREVLTDQERNHTVMFSTWHPDGRRITSWVVDAATNLFSATIPQLWTEPVDGGPAVETRFPPELQKQIEAVAATPGVAEFRTDFRFTWAPSGNAIYFERTFRGARNVWRVTVDPVTLQAIKVERLTTSPGLDAEFAICRDGSKLAFTSERQQIRGWEFPFDANAGHLKGPGRSITSPGIEAWSFDLSGDGRKLAVAGNRDGRGGIWETPVPNGREEPMVPDDSYLRSLPLWSPDGKRAAYTRSPASYSSNTSQVVVWSSESRSESFVGPETSYFRIVCDWSRDGKSLLIVQSNDRTNQPEIWQLPLDVSKSGESSARRIAFDPNYELYQPHMSPDGRWIVFEAVSYKSSNSESTLYVIPAAGGPWTRITDSRLWDDKPRWSPDGKTIYYLSERRGFFNLWGVRFDPVKGRPEGKPFQVTSFEGPNLMIPRQIPAVDISITSDHLVLPLVQASGNIWILDNVDR